MWVEARAQPEIILFFKCAQVWSGSYVGPKRVSSSSRVGVPGSFELSNVGAGNWTLAFGKSSKYFSLLSHLSSPHFGFLSVFGFWWILFVLFLFLTLSLTGTRNWGLQMQPGWLAGKLENLPGSTSLGLGWPTHTAMLDLFFMWALESKCSLSWLWGKQVTGWALS